MKVVIINKKKQFNEHSKIKFFMDYALGITFGGLNSKTTSQLNIFVSLAKLSFWQWREAGKRKKKAFFPITTKLENLVFLLTGCNPWQDCLNPSTIFLGGLDPVPHSRKTNKIKKNYSHRTSIEQKPSISPTPIWRIKAHLTYSERIALGNRRSGRRDLTREKVRIVRKWWSSKSLSIKIWPLSSNFWSEQSNISS